MPNQKELVEGSRDLQLKIVAALRQGNLRAAQADLVKAVSANADAPEPHNLFGILFELLGDDERARRHYRAAYALDPTYRPACHNLERLVSFAMGFPNRDFDYGDSEPSCLQS